MNECTVSPRKNSPTSCIKDRVTVIIIEAVIITKYFRVEDQSDKTSAAHL